MLARAIAIALALAVGAWAPTAGAKARPARKKPPATGTLVIQAPVPEAKVVLDDVELGTIPLPPQSVAPGKHILRVTKPGFTEHAQEVEIAPGKTVMVLADLLAVAGVLSVTCAAAGAEVFLDGKLLAPVPLEAREVPPGDHQLLVRAQGHEDWRTKLEVTAGKDYRLEVTLRPAEAAPAVAAGPEVPVWERWWFWAGVGAVVVTAVAVPMALSGGEPTYVEKRDPDGACGGPCDVVLGVRAR